MRKNIALIVGVVGTVCTGVNGQDETYAGGPWAIAGGTLEKGPYGGPYEPGQAPPPGVTWGSLAFGSGLITSRVRVVGAAAARSGTVPLNVRQTVDINGGTSRLNIYVTHSAQVLIARPAAGTTTYDATAEVHDATHTETRTVRFNEATPPLGEASRFGVDSILNQPAGPRALTHELRTTITASTDAGAVGANDVDFYRAIGGADVQRGFISHVMASPRDFADSRAAIGIEKARAVGSKLLVDGNTCTGDGVKVGIVELGRPSRLHKALEDGGMSIMTVDPGSADTFWAEEHALAVAGIMVGRSAVAASRGVAHKSTLYASAFLSRPGANVDERMQRSLAWLVETSGVKVINGSFGTDPPRTVFNPATSDGDSHLSRALDWIVQNHGVIVVMAAGNHGNAGGILLPGERGRDHPALQDRASSLGGYSSGYNVLTAGALDFDFSSRAYFSSYGPTRDIAGRSKPDIVAPGTFILTAVDADLDGNSISDDFERVFFGTEDARRPAIRQFGGAPISGTSFAAPHIAGAAAVMLEFGSKVKDKNVNRAGVTNADRLDPRVIRAAIINTADRSVKHRVATGGEWNRGGDGERSATPLDRELGAGLLDVNLAMLALRPPEVRVAEIASGAAGTSIDMGETAAGWDVQHVAKKSATTNGRVWYYMPGLAAGSGIRAALTWHARVNEVNGPGGTVGRIDHNDTYTRLDLNNLDLGLQHKKANGTWEIEYRSISTVDNLETITDFKTLEGGRWLLDVNNLSANDETFAIVFQTTTKAARTARRASTDQLEGQRDLLEIELDNNVRMASEYSWERLRNDDDVLHILDEDHDIDYQVGLTYDLYLGPELRLDPMQPATAIDWYSGAPINLAALVNHPDPALRWTKVTSVPVVVPGELAPTAITRVSAPTFFAQLDALAGQDRREYNIAVDVGRDGIFDPQTDAAGWFQVVPVVCGADCDLNRVLDIFDFICFGNLFLAGDPYACDFDTTTGPGVCDIFDFLSFANAFAAGCR